jgi:ribosomal protein L7/L12
VCYQQTDLGPHYYRFLSQKTCFISFRTKNNAKITGLRLLSGSTSAENVTDGNKKDPRYDEDFIDIENTKPYVKNPNIQVTERCENIFKDILQLNSVDVILLLQLLKERTGMDPYSDPYGDGLSFAGGKRKGTDASTAEGAAPVVEKTLFELKLAGFDEKSKIKIIKEIRAILRGSYGASCTYLFSKYVLLLCTTVLSL